MCVCLVTQLCPALCDPMGYPIVAHQALLSMGFSKQEHWSGLPFPLPGNLFNSRIEPTPVSPALAGGFFTIEPLGSP